MCDSKSCIPSYSTPERETLKDNESRLYKQSYILIFTKIVVTITVLFSIPVDSFAKTSDLVTAILSTSFQ